jgi:choice-of-anchor B domain-containing protein
MSRVCALGLMLLSCASAGAQTFPSQNIVLRSHVDLTAFASSPSTGNDCWGYVSPSGREYALVGLRAALAVVEVTDPSNPVIVAEVPHASSLWADVKVYQSYCYVSNESAGGIDIIDLSDVDNGNVTLVGNLTAGGLATVHNVVVDETAGYLYLCGANLNGGRLRAYDLRDPANPAFAGFDDTAASVYCHDAQVVTYTDGPFAGRQIAYCANPAVGLDVVDVTDKNNWVRLARLSYPGLDIAHQCWLSEDRSYLYFGDEGDETNLGFPTTTHIFNVADVDNPFYVGAFSNNQPAIDHNMYVHDGLLYQANYSTGLRVFDLADPESPQEIAWIDTFPEDDRTDFVGAWSVYPFFPSGSIIISDFNRGLFVVELDLETIRLNTAQSPGAFVAPGASAPVGVSVTEVTGTLDPATVELRWRVDPGDAFQSVAFTDGGAGVFTGALPPFSCVDTPEYYFAARDAAGDEFRLPASAPLEVFTVEVGEETIDFTDDMETDRGWTVGAPGDSATTGIWVRAEPVGTAAQPDQDTTADPGQLCWVTGNGVVGGALGANDIDGGATTLVSPLLDLSGLTQPRIAYDRWYSNASGAAPGEDIFVVEISNNGGASWVNVETVGPSGIGTAGGWVRKEFDVSSVVTPTAQVRLRFRASDVGGGSIVEAAIDGFEVSDVVCEDPNGCASDFDGDGDVDLGDFGVFGGAFGSLVGDANYDPAADFDMDGDVDLGDFGAFGGEFGRTDCP